MRRTLRVALSLPLVFYVLASFAFMAYAFINPFKTQKEFYDNITGWPKTFTLDNMVNAWLGGKFYLYFMNSVAITALTVVLYLALAACTSYGMARYAFRGSRVVYLYFLIGLMLPPNLFVIPLYLQLRSIGLVNTLPGLILVFVATMLSFGIFILTGFFRTLPTEIHEAAKLEGASEGTVFRKIMLPLTRPVLGTLGIIASISVWNEFFFTLVFIHENTRRTLPLAMQLFYEANKQNWPLVFAALFIVTMPMVLVFFVGSKQIISGLTSGAVKS